MMQKRKKGGMHSLLMAGCAFFIRVCVVRDRLPAVFIPTVSS